MISVGGTYYIKATSGAGCETIKPVVVTINPLPVSFTIDVIDPTCSVATGEISFAAEQGVEYAFENTFANLLVPNNGIITVSGLAAGSNGTVFARTVNTTCVVSANYSIADQPETPVLVVSNPAPVCGPAEIDLASTINLQETTQGATFTYFEQGSQVPLQSSTVSTSGTYVIRATNAAGCFVEEAVEVVIESCALNIVKSNDYTDNDASGDVSVGDVITYTFEVENTGTATLTGVTVEDDKLGAVTLDKTTLLPGEKATGTLDYTVLVSDLGTTITNIATADSDQTEEDTDTNDVPVAAPALNIVKSNDYTDNDASGDVSVGDVITYTFEVENTGTATLTGVTVEDDKLGAVTLDRRRCYQERRQQVRWITRYLRPI